MRRLLPDTFAGWFIVVLIGGLALSQCVTLAVNYRTRTGAATVLEHFRIAERVADVVRLVGSAPPDQRKKMLARLTGPTLRAKWSSRAAISDAPPSDWHAQLFDELVQSALWDVPWRELRVDSGRGAAPGRAGCSATGRSAPRGDAGRRAHGERDHRRERTRVRAAGLAAARRPDLAQFRGAVAGGSQCRLAVVRAAADAGARSRSWPRRYGPCAG